MVAWVMGGCPGQKAVAGEFRVQPEDQTSLEGAYEGKRIHWLEPAFSEVACHKSHLTGWK